MAQAGEEGVGQRARHDVERAPEPGMPGDAAADDRIGREVPSAQVLEAAPDAMLVIDAQGAIVYANAEAEKLFGYAREELRGALVEALMPEAQREAHLWHRRRYAEQPRTRPMGQALHIVARRKDGSEIPADVKLSPLKAASGLLITAAIRDMTEIRRSEEQLRTYARHLEELEESLKRQNRELERKNRELEQFAYVSSHDLQEPLRKIVAFGDRLRSRCGPALDERGIDYLERMTSAAQRMQLLINDLLEFSRLSTRARGFERVDLRQIALATVSDLEVLIERTGGSVEVGEIGVIDADPSQMGQLFQNLIENALKFHRAEAPPRVKVWGAPRGEGGRPPAVEIRVEDSGIGIEPRFRERIFTVFERLNPRARYEGTGIGLAICKKIAERHGGDIVVESEPGRGSTFVVTLPSRHEGRGEAMTTR
ncbi:MAG: PAS domain S-box protein [Polyangiaceae bacterium]|nr:PAS domain S-box protein [Polyangiaceae bacterium]